MSTIRANQWLNLDGTENYKCRAWVNFNGTGTPSIRASGNVASITDNGLGDFTVNFTSPMPDVNYAVLISVDNSFSNAPLTFKEQSVADAVGSVRVGHVNASATRGDPTRMYVGVFR